MSLRLCIRGPSCICAAVPACGSKTFEHHPYIHENSTLSIRCVAQSEPHGVRFRMCRKSRGRRIRTSREARSSSGLIAAYPFPPRPETRFSENVWAGATPALFSPRASGEKWGRSRPLRCITRVQTARRVMFNLYAPNNFASPLGDVNGDGDGYVCLSRTRHLSAREKAFESH